MAQIVKELLTKWTYKVDARQIKETGKKIRDLKKNMADVKKASSVFATSEVRKVNRIRDAWRSLTTQARAYRRETAMAAKGRTGGGFVAGAAGGSAFKTFAGARALGLGAGAAAGLAAGPGIAALTGLGGALKAAMGAEVAKVELEGFLKSGKKAEEFMERLAVFGSETPFEIPQLENLSVQLLAGGFAANELLPTLERLGNVTGGNADKLNRMLINLVQIRQNNRAYTQDLKQFAMAGIPIFQALQKTLGATQQEVREMAKNGKIDFKAVNDALKSMTENGGMFEGRMRKISKTLQGRISNLRDAFFRLGRALAGPLLEPLSWLVMHFSAFIEDIATGIKWVSQFGTAWKVVGTILTGIMFLLKPLTFKITALYLIIEDIVAFFAGRKSVLGALVKGMADLSISLFDGFFNVFTKLKKEIGEMVQLIPAPIRNGFSMVSSGAMAMVSAATMDRQGMESYGKDMMNSYNAIFNQENNFTVGEGGASEAVEAVNQMSASGMRSMNRQLKPSNQN